MTRKNRKGWPNEPYRHGMASKGIKTTNKSKGFKGMKVKYDGRPEELEEKLEELATEENYDNYDLIDWAETHNLMRELKETEFWDVIVKENPLLTGETLKYYVKETDEGEDFLENHWEALHEIEFGSAGYAPYWLENVEDKGRELVPLEKGKDIVTHHIGTIDTMDLGDNIKGDTLNSKYDTELFDEDTKYKFVGTARADNEIEIQADNGDLEYFNIGQNHFKGWKPTED